MANEKAETTKFEIIDLVSKKVLDVVQGKNNADMRFVKLQKQYPKRKLHMKIAVHELIK